MSQHDEVCEHGLSWTRYCRDCEAKTKKVNKLDVIKLGQEATAWITGDTEIAMETKTLEDSVKAIATALELGRISHTTLAHAKDIIYSLRRGVEPDCWCSKALHNNSYKHHTTTCLQTQAFISNHP